MLNQKYLQDLYHVFIDFQKAFDKVWYDALKATMRMYNINASIKKAIENLYNNAKQKCTVIQWHNRRLFQNYCLGLTSMPSPQTLFDIFKSDALEDHKSSAIIEGRILIFFHFADDTVANVEGEDEADDIATSINPSNTTCTRYTIVGPDNTRIITNHSNCFQREIKIND